MFASGVRRAGARGLVLLSLALLMMLAVAPGAFAGVGTFIGTWGSTGTGVGQLNYPSGIAVGANGIVYVADTDNHRVQYFSANGTWLGAWGSAGTGNGQFGEMYSLTVAPNGDVYVTDSTNNRIQYFSRFGTYKGKWGTAGTGNGQFANPIGIAAAPNGDVYVSDFQNDRIQYFGPTGSYKGKWGTTGTGNGQFDSPVEVAIAPSGDVYVADMYNDRVQYFSATGTFKGKWGSAGTGGGQFDTPRGIEVSPDGFVYVADTNNHRIQYFGLHGTYRGVWGAFGTEDRQFRWPYALALSSLNGAVYVTDNQNDRVQYFVGQGGIQHDAGGVTFGRWITGYNNAYSGGGYVYTRWAGESIEVRFTGSYFAWYGPRQSNYGKADVYMDGALAGTIDCYRPAGHTSIEDLLWGINTRYGAHTVRIVATGTKHPESSGTIVVVDRFETDGVPGFRYSSRSDQSDATLSGRWVSASNSAYVDKGYVYSRYPSASLSFNFTGKGVAWIGPKTGAYGRAKVYIDGVQQGTVVSQRGTMAWRTVVWESPTLPYGPHTLKIVPTGTKDAASTGTNIVVDAIDVRQ